MKKLVFVILVVFAGFLPVLNSQTICLGYGGLGNEFGYDIFTSDHNTFVIAGSTESFGGGGSADLYVLKCNQFGNVLWSRTVGGFGNEAGYGIDQCTNGDYVIAGETNSLGLGGGDMYVVRLDSSGNLLWTRSIGGDNYDVAREVAATLDNGCVVAGTTSSWGLGNDDAYISKLDSLGNVQWTRTVGDVNTESGYGVLASSDGNIVLAGRGFPGFGAAQLFVTKISYGAVVQWSKHFASHDANDLFVPGDIIEANGGYVISGFTDTVFGTNKNTFLTKISPSGNHQWTRIIGITGNDNGASVDKALDGGYLISGTFFGTEAKTFAVKTDSAGTPEWYTRSNASGNNYGFGMIELNNGYFYSIGNSDLSGNQQIFLIKYESDGTSCCGDSIGFSVGYLARNPGNFGLVSAGANLDTGGVAGTGFGAAFLCPPDTTASEIVPDTGFTQIDQGGISDGGEAPPETSAVENENVIPFDIYPNPTDYLISVNWDNLNENYSYLLFNVQGKFLRSGTVTNHSNIYLDDIAPGMYILQIHERKVKIIKR